MQILSLHLYLRKLSDKRFECDYEAAWLVKPKTINRWLKCVFFNVSVEIFSIYHCYMFMNTLEGSICGVEYQLATEAGHCRLKKFPLFCSAPFDSQAT